MLSRNRLLTALAIGVPSAIGVYLLYRYLNRGTVEAPPTKEFTLGQFDDQVLNQSVSEVKDNLNDKPLHIQQGVIERIYRKSVEVIKPQFVQLTKYYRNRNIAVDVERRQLTDPTAQVASILEYEAKVKELKDSSLNCILARLDISEDVWNFEVMAWLTPQRNDQWAVLLADLEQEMKEALLTREKNLTIAQLHNIFGHHIKFLRQLDSAKYGLSHLKQEEVIGVVNHLVSDELFKKYKVESEDIQNALGQLSEEEYSLYEKEHAEITSLNTNFVVGEDNDES